MEKAHRYHPERPRLLSVFIILAIIWDAISLLHYINSGVNNFANPLSLILLSTQIYGLLRLWKLEENGLYLWIVPQFLLLIQIASMPDPLPFIIEAVFTVLFFYCIGPAWNSLS